MHYAKELKIFLMLRQQMQYCSRKTLWNMRIKLFSFEQIFLNYNVSQIKKHCYVSC